MTGSSDFTVPPHDAEGLKALHQVLRYDPQRYLQIVNGWIEKDAEDWGAYFSRHFAWMSLGQPQRALEDLDRCIAARPSPADYFARGDVHRHMGAYAKALEDFDQGEAMDPAEWQADVMGVYYQADVHARLGDKAAALACCARLPDDFWTPGPRGAPSGGKAQVAEELRRMAARARGETLAP